MKKCELAHSALTVGGHVRDSQQQGAVGGFRPRKSWLCSKSKPAEVLSHQSVGKQGQLESSSVVKVLPSNYTQGLEFQCSPRSGNMLRQDWKPI